MSKKARRRPSWKHNNSAYRWRYIVLGGRRVWLSRRLVTAKKRALSANWTIEIAQDLTSEFGTDADDELAKTIREDIDNQYIKYMIDRMTGNYDNF